MDALLLRTLCQFQTKAIIDCIAIGLVITALQRHYICASQQTLLWHLLQRTTCKYFFLNQGSYAPCISWKTPNFYFSPEEPLKIPNFSREDPWNMRNWAGYRIISKLFITQSKKKDWISVIVLYAAWSQHFFGYIKMSFQVSVTVLYTQKAVNVLGKLFCIF